MGQDKSLLVVDGAPMAIRVAHALRAAGAASVLAQGGDAVQLAALGLDVVADDERGAGPLPATIQALRSTTADIVLVVGCDLIAPSSHALRTTADALHAEPMADAAVPVAGGHRQWAHVAWRPHAASALDRARSEGATSLRRAAADLTVVELHHLDPRALADADSPLDLVGWRTTRRR